MLLPLLELTGWHLLLLLLNRLERHRGVALYRLPPVELVHFVVDPCDDLRRLGPAPLGAGGRFLLHGGLHEGGSVGGSQVG